MKETVIGLGLLLSGLAMTACTPVNTPQGARPAASLPSGVSSRPLPAPGSCHMRSGGGQPLPDPACTPGAVNPDVTQASIGSTICKSGWTATVRPPVSVTNRIKQQTDIAYGLPTSTVGELDHLVSLELGGAPADTRNLWVEPGKIPNPKDAVESKLHAAICTGRVTLVAAQKAIATDWTTALVVTGAGR